MTNDHLSLSAAVLAGGLSSRMGQNKALMPLVPGGIPMLAMVLEHLEQIADDLMIVANDWKPYDQFGVRIVPDLRSGFGALGGIDAAVRGALHDHCMVVACDMPFLSSGLLRRMAREPRDYDVLAPLVPGESRQGFGGFVYQTLHAIYGKSCAGAIERRLNGGDRRVIGFFEDVRVRTIDADEVRRWDPDLRSFFNANTPEALANASKILKTMEQHEPT